MTETDLSAWLPIADAAAILRVSERTVERLKAAGKLEHRTRPQKGTPDVTVFSPESVAEQAAKSRRTPAPFVVDADPGVGHGNGRGRALQKVSEAGQGVSAEDLIRQFFVLAAHALQSPPSPTVSESHGGERLFLTIAEAAAVAGLSKTYIKRACESQTLKAVKDRGWRIRRTDLEAL